MKYYRGEFPSGHPEFDAKSAAAISENPHPVAIDAPDIQYTAEDNEVVKNYVRKNGA